LEKKELHKRQFVEKLNEEKKNTLVDHEKEKKQKEANLSAVRSKLSELQGAEKAKQNEIQGVNDALDKAKKAIRDKEFDVKNYENRCNNLKKDIESFRAAQRNKIFRFGENMHQLVEDVKANYEAKRFSEMPRGPIGMYLQPKSNEWSLAIEQCLGQLLYAFVCNNYEDERFLQKLISKHIKQVHKRPRIIVMDFKTPLYDHTKYRPAQTQYPTVYEMLHIKEDLIANTLFDQRRIESVLLLPNREIGKELIERNSTQNCYEAFLKNGDQLLGKPSFRMYTCPYKQAYLFVENSQNLLEQKQNEIKSMTDQIRTFSQEIEHLREQVNSNKRLSMDYEKQLDSIRRNILIHNSVI
jgi:chromosome segregation ATPase